MRNYAATVKVTRYYEIGFDSPDFKQALIDAETILTTEYFNGEFVKEDRKIVGVKHDDS